MKKFLYALLVFAVVTPVFAYLGNEGTGLGYRGENPTSNNRFGHRGENPNANNSKQQARENQEREKQWQQKHQGVRAITGYSR